MNVTIIITVLVLLAGCHWIKNDEMLWRKHAVVLTPGIGEMIDGKLAHGSIVKLDDGTERHGSGDFGVCLPGENAMVDVGDIQALT